MDAEKYVCSTCVPDKGLVPFIRDNGEQRPCDYCGSEGEAAPFSVLVHHLAEHIRQVLLEEYGDVDSESVSYDNEEGSYYCETYDTHDLLVDQVGLEADDHVIADLVAILPDSAWCKSRSPVSGLAAALGSGWVVFSDLVKHNTRYLMLDPPDFEGESPPFSAYSCPFSESLRFSYDRDEGVPPNRMLFALGGVISKAPNHLTRLIEPGTPIFRARQHEAHKSPSTAAELGPPPREQATQSNRMSPAGIVMFYGAFDSDTAVCETFDSRRADASTTVISVATFRCQRALTVLDLADLPVPPSFFLNRDLHYGLCFLHDFEEDFVKPIERDGREHIEYAPSQVVTEYVRYQFRPVGDNPVDGIVYRSSKTHQRACVLFLDRSDCGADNTLSTRPQSLRLDEDATVRLSGADLINDCKASRAGDRAH